LFYILFEVKKANNVSDNYFTKFECTFIIFDRQH